MNENLTARVKTKAGLTEEIKREKGGKQGGKLMVPMFSKMMDTLPESMHTDANLGVQLGNATVAGLVFVDDIVSMAIGYAKQEKHLQTINDFSVMHQLEWSEDKCKVMEIGNHKEKKSSWNLGEKEIYNCQTYKYLGEIISRNGKNAANIKERLGKVKAAVTEILTCARSDIMRKIETNVLLKLHETVVVPILLYGSETWVLDSNEMNQLERIELLALKWMFGLPPTTT